MDRTFFRRLLSASALVVATVASLPAQAGPFSSLFVFGDSLSDNGNNALAGLYDPTQVVTGNSYIPTNTYASGVYSNGPVWATYFASMLGVPLLPSLVPGGTDYAFGGATTGSPGDGPGGFPYSLRAQADMYLGSTGNVAQADALYVVAGGGNNGRAALGAILGGADPVVTALATASAYADDVGDIVDELQLAGATHILVWNTPNLGLGPALVAAGGAAVGSFLAGTMNAALAARLSGEAGVSLFDLFSFNTLLVTNPAFGFTNGTTACGAVAGADCSQYVYWDGIHPTTAGHLALANAVAAAVPEPQTYALLAFGLLAVMLRGRVRAGR